MTTVVRLGGGETEVVARSAMPVSAQALFDWREYGIMVGTTLIARKVENIGNKGAVSQTWIFVITATQAA